MYGLQCISNLLEYHVSMPVAMAMLIVLAADVLHCCDHLGKPELEMY